MFGLWIVALAAAQSPYAGSAVCARCHVQQHAAQSKSGHAMALFRIQEHPLRERIAAQQLTRGRFTYQWDGSTLAAADGQSASSAAAQWAFGSGRHGVTFVGRLDSERFVELALSYYPKGILDLTPGHEKLRPRDLAEALGQIFRARGPGFVISRCFECHSTGPVGITSDAVQLSEHGVRCEACHGPGARHAAGPTARDAILARRGMDPDEVNALCGGCHRAPGGDHANDFSDPWNVRHQPPYLAQSKCFQQPGGGLSCLTCHSPHEALRSDAAVYNGRCMGCHAKPPKPCAKDCVACHMPPVPASARLTFRNHWIGVYGGTDSLIPVR